MKNVVFEQQNVFSCVTDRAKISKVTTTCITNTVENHSIATHSIACSLLRTTISGEHYFDDH